MIKCLVTCLVVINSISITRCNLTETIATTENVTETAPVTKLTEPTANVTVVTGTGKTNVTAVTEKPTETVNVTEKSENITTENVTINVKIETVTEDVKATLNGSHDVTKESNRTAQSDKEKALRMSLSNTTPNYGFYYATFDARTQNKTAELINLINVARVLPQNRKGKHKYKLVQPASRRSRIYRRHKKRRSRGDLALPRKKRVIFFKLQPIYFLKDDPSQRLRYKKKRRYVLVNPDVIAEYINRKQEINSYLDSNEDDSKELLRRMGLGHRSGRILPRARPNVARVIKRIDNSQSQPHVERQLQLKRRQPPARADNFREGNVNYDYKADDYIINKHRKRTDDTIGQETWAETKIVNWDDHHSDDERSELKEDYEPHKQSKLKKKSKTKSKKRQHPHEVEREIDHEQERIRDAVDDNQEIEKEQQAKDIQQDLPDYEAKQENQVDENDRIRHYGQVEQENKVLQEEYVRYENQLENQVDEDDRIRHGNQADQEKQFNEKERIRYENQIEQENEALQYERDRTRHDDKRERERQEDDREKQLNSKDIKEQRQYVSKVHPHESNKISFQVPEWSDGADIVVKVKTILKDKSKSPKDSALASTVSYYEEQEYAEHDKKHNMQHNTIKFHNREVNDANDIENYEKHVNKEKQTQNNDRNLEWQKDYEAYDDESKTHRPARPTIKERPNRPERLENEERPREYEKPVKIPKANIPEKKKEYEYAIETTKDVGPIAVDKYVPELHAKKKVPSKMHHKEINVNVKSEHREHNIEKPETQNIEPSYSYNERMMAVKDVLSDKQGSRQQKDDYNGKNKISPKDLNKNHERTRNENHEDQRTDHATDVTTKFKSRDSKKTKSSYRNKDDDRDYNEKQYYKSPNYVDKDRQDEGDNHYKDRQGEGDNHYKDRQDEGDNHYKDRQDEGDNHYKDRQDEGNYHYKDTQNEDQLHTKGLGSGEIGRQENNGLAKEESTKQKEKSQKEDWDKPADNNWDKIAVSRTTRYRDYDSLGMTQGQYKNKNKNYNGNKMVYHAGYKSNSHKSSHQRIPVFFGYVHTPLPYKEKKTVYEE